MHDFFGRLLADGIVNEMFTVLGFVLAVILIARLMGEKRAPSNTFAWLLIIILLPWIGVPLYLLIGGRKLRLIAARKSHVLPMLPGAVPASATAGPVAHTLVACGAPPPVGGNTVRLLTTGEDTWAELERRIRGARRCIHITTFSIGRDETGRRLVNLLAARAREGVKVRLLLDAVGCMFLSRAFFMKLKRAGGEVEWFMPVLPFTSRGSANLRSHRKIAVFDDHTAITGGHNLARHYLGPTPWRKRWRDFGAVIEGPAAALLNGVFLADWCFVSGQPAEKLEAEIRPAEACAARGCAELQVVASGPDVPGDALYEGIIAMIQEAQQSIHIVTPYFLPDEVLLRSLIVKARAGREVTVIVPVRSDHPITDFARRHPLRELVRAGARVRLVGLGMLHSKALLVDDRVALFGSANFDPRSLFVNFEIGVFVHSHAEVRAMRAWADGLLASAHALKPERVGKFRPLVNLVEEVSRLLAPLL